MQDNVLKHSDLGCLCDRCDSKKHKTPGYTRAYARVKGDEMRVLYFLTLLFCKYGQIASTSK